MSEKMNCVRNKKLFFSCEGSRTISDFMLETLNHSLVTDKRWTLGYFSFSDFLCVRVYGSKRPTTFHPLKTACTARYDNYSFDMSPYVAIRY